MVVADRDHDPAASRASSSVAVADGVASPVQARALAIPERKDALDLRALEQVGLLAAPHGGRGEFLVDAGTELDPPLGQEAGGARDLLVEPGEGGAAIAGHEPSRPATHRSVVVGLFQQQPDEGLRTGRQDSALLAGVPVVQADVRKACSGH